MGGFDGLYAYEGVDASKLNEVTIAFAARLFGALGNNPRWSTEQGSLLFDDVAVKGNVAKIKLLAMSGGVTEWEDERIENKFKHYDQELDIKKYQESVCLDLDNLDDERESIGQYDTAIRMMADDFDEHPHQLMIDMITNALTTTKGSCYDGQAMLSASHPLLDGTTQSNMGDLAFSEDNLRTAIKQMSLIKKPNGIIANVRPTHVLAPEALRPTVEKVLLSAFVADGNGTKDNIINRSAKLQPIIDGRLDAASTTAWYLLDLSKPIKPFFRGVRRPVTPRVKVVDWDRKAWWGADARYGFSYGYYQLMWGTDGVP